jgi:hypothetical protein
MHSYLFFFFSFFVWDQHSEVDRGIVIRFTEGTLDLSLIQS